MPDLKLSGAPLEFAPDCFQAELSDWINFGIFPDDDLLQAILRNDLAAVVGLTGSSTLVRSAQIWLWNFAPPAAFGSLDKVQAWERRGGLDRKALR